MNCIRSCRAPIRRAIAVHAILVAHTPPVSPGPDVPDDPGRESDLPDVNPGSNPANPGDDPRVTEPGKPAKVVA
jgi:hypothetical protein